MNKRFLMIICMILVAALSRLVPHPSNFTPLMAIALFGGAHLSRRLAFLIPLAAMFLSDFIIGFHSQIVTVYLSFALIVVLGLTLKDNRTISRTAGTALAGSLLFFVLTNLGVWAFDALYPRTAQGLVTCYIMALPFLKTQLLGDALYTFVLFGGLSAIQWRVPALREATSA